MTASHQSIIDSGAQFSPCRRLRFSLWRTWDADKPKVLFIGLNPSTADAERDDPTMRRVGGFARDLGFGGFYMANVFPHISTNPKDLNVNLGLDENEAVLSDLGSRCQEVLFCWGAFKQVKETGMDLRMIEAFPEAKVLAKNKDGSPKHPLYIRAGIRPVSYR